jgi:hypothetical protein
MNWKRKDIHDIVWIYSTREQSFSVLAKNGTQLALE